MRTRSMTATEQLSPAEQTASRPTHWLRPHCPPPGYLQQGHQQAKPEMPCKPGAPVLLSAHSALPNRGHGNSIWRLPCCHRTSTGPTEPPHRQHGLLQTKLRSQLFPRLTPSDNFPLCLRIKPKVATWTPQGHRGLTLPPQPSPVPALPPLCHSGANVGAPRQNVLECSSPALHRVDSDLSSRPQQR